MVQTTNGSSPRGTMLKPEDIVFIETDTSWVHHPHKDALVITTKIANNFIHWVLIDSGSAVNILCWNAYQKIGLKWVDLCPTTSPLYRFTKETVISEGIIKLAVTLTEAPRMVTIVIDFLVVNCPSAYDGVLGRPLLRALKAIISVHCLTIKLPTTTGMGQVRGRYWDSRECHNKSLELAEKWKELPQTMEVEKTRKGMMETNIDPRLQEDESTTGPVEELVDV